MKRRVLVVTGGGDCPGLNAVIRAIVKRASQEQEWEVLGSMEAYNGILREPMEIEVLDEDKVSGIHVKGGTIIRTTNKGGPFAWPVKNKDGEWTTVDRSEELVRKLQYNNIEAVISIGGDGSQKFSQRLYEMGLNIIGVPKTIDNDLKSTDFTFGFQTAVESATDAVDKLVTTAASHNRVLILEVMGRFAGWIALNAAIAGGAEVALIPEIPYDIKRVVKCLQKRVCAGSGFAIVVIAEGAVAVDGKRSFSKSGEVGYENVRLGGAGFRLMHELRENGFDEDMRVTILGHLQRGGIPNAYDRILASQFGVKAFEMVLDGEFGKMVAYKHPNIVTVPIKEAISEYNYVDVDSDLVKTARGLGICLGDI